MKYNNKDGEVIIKKCDKGRIITFIDENDYKKKERAVRIYNMRTYKQIVFYLSKELKRNDLELGDYETELITDENFKKVYGAIKLKYTVTPNATIITDIAPGDFLLKLHSVLAPTYKGVPYTNQKELLKIKLILGG